MKKRKIRMVGLDLDGTVFNEEKKITPNTKRVLQKAAEQGVIVLPATGRPEQGLPKEMLEIPGIQYALTSNGSRIIKVPSGEVIYQELIPWDVVRRVILLVRQWEHCVWEVYLDGEIYVEEGEYRFLKHPDMTPALVQYIQHSRQPKKNLFASMEEEQRSAEKMHMVFDNTEERDRRLAELKTIFPELEVSCATTFNIEMNSAKAGKGVGLLELGKLLGISGEEIMACGDAPNDWNMLQKVGFPVVMANGTPETKQLAAFITRSNQEDGVAYALEQYVLEGKYCVRKGKPSDLLQIMEIVHQAQAGMGREKIPQWQNGYPNERVIKSDIEKESCFVVEEGERVVAFGVLCLGEEPTYRRIEEGAWTTGERYATIHRLSVAEDKKCQGLATFLYDALERICREKGIPAIRIDTHRENRKMQAWIEKQGFTRSGVIYVDDHGADSPRDAFEKRLSGIFF